MAEGERSCRVCGGALRRSHVAYLGGDREAVVHRCTGCGTTTQGPVTSRDERVRSEDVRGSRRRRPLPDEGSPENPVIDSDLARMLRERFGGGGGAG